jgi:hypothetical protein
MKPAEAVMDLNTAGALAGLSYQNALQSGTPGQALQQAFAAISSLGPQVSPLPDQGSDGVLLDLSTRAQQNVALYKVYAQNGQGSSAVQGLLGGVSTSDSALLAGLDSGSGDIPVSDSNLVAALTRFQYDQATKYGQNSQTYGQQAAAAASQPAAGFLNLLA